MPEHTGPDPSGPPNESSHGRATPIVTVSFGPAALGALAGAIRAARAHDGLAPVCVVTRSEHVAVSVRRHLARVPHDEGCGLAGIRWVSSTQLAEHIAGPRLARDGRMPLTGLLRRAAVRAALDEVPGSRGPQMPSRGLEQRLAETFADLRDAGGGVRRRIAAESGSGAELVARYDAFRRRCAPYVDGREVLEQAASLVQAGAPADQVIWYLPERLSRGERALITALASRGLLVVLLGRTGDERADRPATEVRNQLVADLGDRVELLSAEVPAANGHGGSPPPVFVRAPDAEEEVRVAVRGVLDALARGTAPEDIAVVGATASPYLVLAHELLSAAGIPHHAPATTSLAQSVAGRTVLGFLRLAERGFRRDELFRWVRGSGVRLADGSRVPSAFDRLARQAGVSGSVDRWHERLERLAADRAARRAERGLDDTVDHDANAIEALRSFIDHLARLSRPPEQASWLATARWLATVLDALVGGRDAISARWPVAEVEAYDEVLAVIEALGGLVGIEPDADAQRIRRVLAHELDRPVRAVGTFGHGVFVGGLDELLGARHEVVFVLGMAEGRFPTRGTEVSYRHDPDRRAIEGTDGTLTDPEAERRRLRALLTTAPHRQLSFARLDSAVQREATPSRAFLRELSAVRGTPTGFDELDDLRHPAFVDVSSFVAGAIDGTVAADRQERRMAALLRDEEHHRDLVEGIDAVTARSQRRFSRWTGEVGPFDELRFGGPAEPSPDQERQLVGSATSFEQWATCPFRYLLDHVLRVRPYDQYAEAESIGGLDRGSLVHEVLERFIAGSFDAEPGRPWDAADRARLQELAREVADRYEAAGRTGRRLLWQAERERLARRFDRILAADSRERVRAGVHPAAVELVFGIGDAPPVAFVTGSGRHVSFRGVVDRVDRDPATGRLVVLDYKTGRDDGYGGMAGDITAAGRRLQLVIYGEAARQHFGGGEVEAYYWFVEMGSSTKRLGGEIGARERARFGEVVDVVVDGIEAGQFPANPGEADFFGFTHCAFCPYDRICPAARDDLWEGVQLSPRLDAYRRLTDPVPPDEGGGAPSPGGGS